MSKVSEVYSYVRKYLVSNSGRSPSYGEIMDACGITSKSNVRPILEKLAELGMLELEEGARGIRIPNSRLIVE